MGKCFVSQQNGFKIVIQDLLAYAFHGTIIDEQYKQYSSGCRQNGSLGARGVVNVWH